ncbi:phage capsid protein [Variovorax atrisoli]|uniref:phage capsid protein n=1 Tax=Variovorax atrisoli TaxID=3394203 RepID=UPI0003672084|nr:phage capsid protein [Variovorax paradoxus]
MTDTVTRQFVTQFDSSLRLLAQQKDSRLRATVFDRGTIEGASFTINNLGAVEMDENVTRHGDTIWSDIDHTARTVPMRDFFKALPLDKADIPKMKVNPVTGGQYMQQLVAARNRKIDDIIFAAALGTINSVDGTTGPYTLPAGQIIAAGGTGLTKAKIIQARAIFRANETDDEELFFLWDSLAMTQILSDTTLTSADFMAGKMIQEGNIANKWLGFTWIPYERTTVAGAVHTTAAYAKSAIHFGMGFEEGSVDKRPDKKNSLQVSMAGSYGAGRQDEKKVVQVSFQ